VRSERKPERFSAAHVERAHQGEGAVTDIFELSLDRRAGLHGHVRVAALERLDAGLLVHADDVLVCWGVVVEVQDLVAFAAKFLILRVQPHLLSMRLQTSPTQDPSYGSFAHRHAHGRKMLGQERGRPMRHRYADVLRRPTRLGDYARAIGIRERECGRPARGASASIATGSPWRKRRRHFSAVRS
jgi:hypothetical protein